MSIRKKSVKRLFGLMVLYSIFANFAHPITPTFIQNLGLHDYMFGVAFGSMALTNFLFSPFWGKLSHNFGRINLIAIGYIGYGIGQGIFGLATSELGIIIGRLFAGVFIGSIMVNQLLYILANSAPEDQGKNLAIGATITAVVSPFGYMIGGFLGDYSIPLTFALQVVGLCSVGLLHWVFLDDDRIDEPLPFKEVLKESDPIKTLLDARSIMTAVLIAFFGIAITTSFASTCYDQCFNYFIKDQFGFPPSYNGLLKAVIGFISLIANSTICMWILKKTDISRSMIYILTGCTAVVTAVLLINDMVPFIIVNIVFYTFNAIYQPILQAILARFKQHDNGILVGVFNSMRSLGMVAGSLFAGFIYEVGPRLSFFSAAIAFFLSVIFAIVCYKRMQEEKLVALGS